MLLNYFLVRHNIPCIRLLYMDFERYLEVKEEYLKGNNKLLEDFFKEIILKSKFQTIKFNNELKPISLEDIKSVFITDKEKLIEKYHVKNIYLFGSFGKKIERLDSDIDLLVRFNEGNSYERKKEIMEYLNNHYMDIFKRFIDFGEISDEINDGFILENNKLIKII